MNIPGLLVNIDVPDLEKAERFYCAAFGLRAARGYARHWTPLHLNFVVSDLSHALVRATAAGATVEKVATTHAWGRIALLVDPFGNGFCLLQFEGRGYDEIAK